MGDEIVIGRIVFHPSSSTIARDSEDIAHAPSVVNTLRLQVASLEAEVRRLRPGDQGRLMDLMEEISKERDRIKGRP